MPEANLTPVEDEAQATVERSVDLDATVDEVWQAVCDPTRWLADDGWIDVVAGGSGRLVDDGVEREVRVDDVVPGQRLAFRWWTGEQGADRAGRVELTVLGGASHTTLIVRETRVASVAGASLRWGVRAVCLAAGVGALAPV